MTAKFQVALVGASGYAGQVLHALCMHHPCISRVLPVSGQQASKAAIDSLLGCDLVFLALPQSAAEAWSRQLLVAGAQKVIDLSPAHRLDKSVHYGLPELAGAPPSEAKLVANPGCYPTASLLLLAPLLRAKAIAEAGIAIHGASGASGAGKELRADLQFCELAESSFPYRIGEHKHAIEISSQLGAEVCLATSMLPISRGILVTAFVRPLCSPQVLREVWLDFYANSPWVTVMPTADLAMGLRHVRGRHDALLACGPVTQSGLLPLFCSIDNLMRGAASQALQNANLWLGLEPGIGIPEPLRAPPQGLVGMRRDLP